MAGGRSGLLPCKPQNQAEVHGDRAASIEQEGTRRDQQPTRRIVVSLVAGGVVMTGVAAPASAATQRQDGLVNVAVGDIILQDVHIGVAAQIAATVCGLKVGPVAVLGRAVDRSGATSTACTTTTGPVVLSQN